jgi:hypothetical protein
MIYVDRDNDLVIVARWINSSSMNEVIGRFLAARN